MLYYNLENYGHTRPLILSKIEFKNKIFDLNALIVLKYNLIYLFIRLLKFYNFGLVFFKNLINDICLQ